MTQAPIQQIQASDEETINSVGSIAKSNKKVKVAVYLTGEAEKALAELYITRYRKDRKTDRSAIVSEAILDFYQRERTTEQQNM